MRPNFDKVYEVDDLKGMARRVRQALVEVIADERVYVGISLDGYLVVAIDNVSTPPELQPLVDRAIFLASGIENMEQQEVQAFSSEVR